MAPRRTVERTTYTPTLRAVDAALGLARAVGLPVGRIDEPHLLETARRRVGHDDFGDPRFLVAMRRILAEAAAAPMTNIARVAQQQAFTKALTNRLQLRAWRARHPEIDDIAIERPIFVLGFPRTGTTLLQNLLAQDGGRRALQFWEIMSPAPVHADPAVDRRRRVASARRALSVAYRVAPEMDRVHYISAETAEECWPLFANSFSVLNWDLQAGLRGYGEWLTHEWDMRWAYHEYREALQVLLHRRPAEGLVLKCPEHLWFLDALLEVFPDACVVWTHRDPYDTIASYCSLMSLQWRTLWGEFDPLALGAYIDARFHEGVERAVAARARANPARFFDVRFSDLVRDPVAMVNRIADHFDLPRGASADAAVRAYLSTERSDARGKHIYDGAFYGLDPDALRARYARYIHDFGVRVRAA